MAHVLKPILKTVAFVASESGAWCSYFCELSLRGLCTRVSHMSGRLQLCSFFKKLNLVAHYITKNFARFSAKYCFM